MADFATPNLPSRNYDATEEFYGKLGFERIYRAHNWMILDRGSIKLEFFPHPDLDPLENWFSACLRLDDLPAMMQLIEDVGIPETTKGAPRFHPARPELGDVTVGYLIDPDGTLLRLVQNS
ncbi:MAG: bleomycin resistance protein [Pseudomonadota bacterium]